jgi:nitroimidazol reductase NimA-like FMN-containing flavoprotein (pyridoxamine 5'-phosphate oxidase superfamily)
MQQPFDKLRRTDRQEADESFLYSMLNNAVSCSVAIPTDDYPLIHATFFIYDQPNNEVIFHFSKYGFGGQEIMNDKKVAISIYKYGRLYTADKAVDFGGEYQSVVIYGKIRIADNEAEKMYAMKIFFDRFFSHIPKHSYKHFTVTETNPIHVVKVKIEHWFGKQHLVPEKAITSFYPAFKPTI